MYKRQVKTLIDTFRYPRLGPGMMWEACAEKVRKLGGEVLLGRRVVGCRFDSTSNIWIVTSRDANGDVEEYRGEQLVSSMPIRELVAQISPHLPEAVLQAARSLRYRDFLTVGLIVNDRGRFNDNWIYIHDPSVQVGRVQNYKSWSPEIDVYKRQGGGLSLPENLELADGYVLHYSGKAVVGPVCHCVAGSQRVVPDVVLPERTPEELATGVDRVLSAAVAKAKELRTSK